MYLGDDFIKIFNALKIYLTDWKNLLTHGLVGVVLLCIALFAPVHWTYRVLFLIAGLLDAVPMIGVGIGLFFIFANPFVG